eukprot:7780341-Pyramimonas_sp.AAC.2
MDVKSDGLGAISPPLSVNDNRVQKKYVEFCRPSSSSVITELPTVPTAVPSVHKTSTLTKNF